MSENLIEKITLMEYLKERWIGVIIVVSALIGLFVLGTNQEGISYFFLYTVLVGAIVYFQFTKFLDERYFFYFLETRMLSGDIKIYLHGETEASTVDAKIRREGVRSLKRKAFWI